MKPKLKIETAKTAELVPYANNAKIHSAEQVEEIAASIEAFGFNDPVGVWTRPDGVMEIVEGHGRIMAANLLHIDTVPIIRLDHLTDDQRRAYVHVHNQTTLSSGFDIEQLNLDLDSIPGYDWEDFGFDMELPPIDFAVNTSTSSLADRYTIPPFSVLDARSGTWRSRRAEWDECLGDVSATRDGKYGTISDGLFLAYNGGTSNFDPVLAEVMMRWFCPSGGKVLDPFAGEQTKGYVAGTLGFEYHGCDIRPEQVAVDREATQGLFGVSYYCGDSNEIDGIIAERGFDLVLTSPPYYDLEVYSKSDMSALPSYGDFMAELSNIFGRCCSMMKEDAFFVVKVGEIRDKKTGVYRGFVQDTIDAATAHGLKYYNELILLQPVGTARLRANKMMQTRKVVRVHQTVLVFYRGDMQALRKTLPALDYSELEAEDGE